jgi:1,2-diacylglycerol 3-alpha-glucosyltransferase
LRIGHLTDVYKPVINGVIHCISLCKKVLESWGHEAYVFTVGNEDYKDTDSNVIRSPAVPLSDTGYHLSFVYSRRARQLAGTMDVLHVHHPFLAGRQALRIASKHGIPLIFTNHTRYDLLVPIYIPLVPAALSSTVLEAYLPHFTNQCDLVVAPSRGTQEAMRRWGVTCPIDVIPNGIDLECFRGVPPRPRAELGLPSSAVVAMYVGRIAVEKNLPFLVSVFSSVASALPNLYLVIVGDGPERAALEGLVRQYNLQERVRFLGQALYQDVPSWLAMADFFVMTSLAESNPLTVIEALACGLPVAAVRTDGVDETVEDGVSGLLSDRTTSSFAACLTRLASDHQLRARLAAGALAASDRFDVRHTATRLLAHYERLMEERARRSSIEKQMDGGTRESHTSPP